MTGPRPAEEVDTLIGTRLRLLLEQLPLGIALSRGDHLLFVNDIYLRLIGYENPGSAADAALWNQLVPQWKRIVLLERKPREEQTEEPSQYESHGFRSDGSTFQFQVNLAHLDLPSGAITVAIITDLVEEKKMKAEMQRFAAFTQYNPNPVLELTAEGQVSYYNEAARKMAASLGKDDPAGILPPGVHDLLKDWVAKGDQEHHCEIMVGQRKISWSLVSLKESQVVHCFSRNISESASPEALAGSPTNSEPSAQWVESIAHDFNNLLTLIQVHASTLLTEKHLDKELADSAEQIYRAVDQAANLTCQLFALSRRQ